MSTTYISASLRREVIERSGGCCEYCRIASADQFFAFERDHIIAEKHGGPTLATNLCYSCPDCNAYKGSDIASVDWEHDERVISLFHPRKQKWHEHFSIDYDTGYIEPLTPSGKVTVVLLRLNDPERNLLIRAGRYPCSP
jgi:hypothetical protein